MEETKSHIRKLGNYVRWLVIVAEIVLIGVIILALIAAGYALFKPDLLGDANDIWEIFEEENSVLVNIAIAMENIPDNIRIMLGALAWALSMLGVLFVIHKIGKIFAEMVRSESPFTDQVARDLKKASDGILLLALVNVLLGLVLFLFVRLFAYLFEYGAAIQKRADETNRIQEEMILSFAEITENKSGQTGKHVKRVAEYSRILATELGMDAVEADRLRLASTMHDIGKLLVPSEILDKPAKLTDEEFAEIKKHTTYGGKLLNNVEGEVMKVARTVALEHHERPDGRGYPEGKQQEAISIEGKIVAVADVYDALTSRRSYKDAWDDTKAYEEIVKGKGTQFDAAVVEAFERAYPKINEARLSLQDAN
ncbi:MAG: HD-GYP domain-containing protein [Lachnospiraceae bacterium]|nr:HD-GYP domain-containing protein [Lachnospiraceae bacterium]